MSNPAVFSTRSKTHGVGERETLRGALDAARAAGKTIVFTNGCFDLLHVGHVRLLQAARAEGDVLVVGLNTDASVQRIKGPSRPVLPEAERARVLAALACVDHVALFDEDSVQRLVEFVAPDVLVKGGQYAKTEIVGWDVVEARGGRVVSGIHIEGHSTTDLIQRAGKEAR